MIVIKATDQASLSEITFEHEVKNKGKVTEEHHFYIRRQEDGRVYHFTMGSAEAKELKAHIL